MDFTLDRSKHQFFLDFADLGHNKSHQVVFDSEKNLWYLVISECPDKCIAIEQSKTKPILDLISTKYLLVYFLKINAKSYYLCHFNDKHVDQYQPVFDQFKDAPDCYSDSESDEDDFNVPQEMVEAFRWVANNWELMKEFLAADDSDGFLRAHCTSKIIKCGISLGLQRIDHNHPNRARCVEAWLKFEI